MTLSILLIITVIGLHIQLSNPNEIFFIPMHSPLTRFYSRRYHPFHPIHPSYAPRFTSTAATVAINPSPHSPRLQSYNSDNNHIFKTNNFFNVSDKPVLANGRIGYVPYGDSIYMNALYNGRGGSSHRARIPNFANIHFEHCGSPTLTLDPNKLACSYSLDVHQGVFRTNVKFHNGDFSVEQTQYAHRYFDSVIVNSLQLKRNAADATGKYESYYATDKILLY